MWSLTHTHHHLFPWLFVFRWFPALSGMPSTVSMRTGVSPSECVAPLPLQRKQQVWNLFAEMYTHVLNMLVSYTNHSHSRAVHQSSCIQPNCTAVGACSIFYAPVGIYPLTVSFIFGLVLGQWLSIVSLNLSLPHLFFLQSLPRCSFFFFPGISVSVSHTNFLSSVRIF